MRNRTVTSIIALAYFMIALALVALHSYVINAQEVGKKPLENIEQPILDNRKIAEENVKRYTATLRFDSMVNGAVCERTICAATPYYDANLGQCFITTLAPLHGPTRMNIECFVSYSALPGVHKLKLVSYSRYWLVALFVLNDQPHRSQLTVPLTDSSPLLPGMTAWSSPNSIGCPVFSGATDKFLGIRYGDKMMPTPYLRLILPRLLQEQGEIKHGHLGVDFIPSTSIITKIYPGSPAAKAGLMPYDWIFAIDGVEVSTEKEIDLKLKLHKPGDRVTLTYHRDGEKQKPVEITLDEWKP